MENNLEELKEKLEKIKIEVKQEKNNASIVKEKIDDLNKFLEGLKKQYLDLEQQKFNKKKPFNLLKPFITRSLKKNLLYIIGVLITILVVQLATANLSIIPIIISVLAASGIGAVDFMFMSKDVRQKIKNINLSEVEKELIENNKKQASVNKEINDLRNVESQIWKKISSSGNIIMSLNNEIKYIEQNMEIGTKSDNKPKELVKQNNPNKR